MDDFLKAVKEIAERQRQLPLSLRRLSGISKQPFNFDMPTCQECDYLIAMTGKDHCAVCIDEGKEQ